MQEFSEDSQHTMPNDEAILEAITWVPGGMKCCVVYPVCWEECMRDVMIFQ